MAKFFLASLFAAAAFATPLDERTNLDCNAVNTIVTVLRQQNVATPFCSSLLHIPTVTKTLTQTSTPPCSTVTSNVQSTDTVTAFATSYYSTVTTVYPVVAVSTTSTCALGATSIASADTTPTPTAKVKRTIPTTSCKPTTTAIGTPTCLKNFIGSKITSACSCLNIPTPTSVSVSTTTLTASTITKVVAVTAKTTITSTITSTTYTSTYSGTQFYTSTFTVLPNPTSTLAPPAAPTEVFGVYPNLDFAGQDIQNFFCYAGGPSAPAPYTPSCQSFNDCVNECAYYNAQGLGASTNQTCGAVVYNAPADGSSGSCYLKTGQTGCGSPNSLTTVGVLLPLIPNDVQ
nr:hypothetical protein B0A51_07787 [Rachicladosporium sp. CCFEE 5018]OQO25105.1 hypothetical protein B0A51_07427 [Rachicladosporium sp. CCFEE 5018]